MAGSKFDSMAVFRPGNFAKLSTHSIMRFGHHPPRVDAISSKGTNGDPSVGLFLREAAEQSLFNSPVSTDAAAAVNVDLIKDNNRRRRGSQGGVDGVVLLARGLLSSYNF